MLDEGAGKPIGELPEEAAGAVRAGPGRGGAAVRGALIAVALATATCGLFLGWRDALHDPALGYLPLVLPFVAWLLWVRRARLLGWTAGSPLPGGLILLVAAALVVAASTTGRDAVAIWGGVLAIHAALLAWLGPAGPRAFPLVFLALLVLVPPPPEVRRDAAEYVEFATQRASARAGVLPPVPPRQAILPARPGVGYPDARDAFAMLAVEILVLLGWVLGRPHRALTAIALVSTGPVLFLACGMVRIAILHRLPEEWVVEPHGPVFFAGVWGIASAEVAMLAALSAILRWALVPLLRYEQALDD